MKAAKICSSALPWLKMIYETWGEEKKNWINPHYMDNGRRFSILMLPHLVSNMFTDGDAKNEKIFHGIFFWFFLPFIAMNYKLYYMKFNSTSYNSGKFPFMIIFILKVSHNKLVAGTKKNWKTRWKCNMQMEKLIK